MNQKINWFNPFRAHIVEFNNGKFAVRRLRLGYQYYDNQKIGKDKDNDYWWNSYTEGNNRYFLLDTLEGAKLVLEMYQLRTVIKSRQVTRIYK